jgi:quinol monooxygenase YgiN
MRAVRSSSHLFLALVGAIYLLPAADPLGAGFPARLAEAHFGCGPAREWLFPVWNNGRMQVVHVHVHVKAECVEAFAGASVENARCSIQEPGIARFDVLQRADDPARFILVEVYRTVEAAAAHKATPHYALWRDTVSEMMAEPRTSVKYANLFPNDNGW